MKTFFNVLYRRILYKIPLKFLLVLLAIVAVFIATTKAEFVVSNYNKTIYTNQNNFIYFSDYNDPTYLCIQNINNCNIDWWIHTSPTNNTSSQVMFRDTLASGITPPLYCITQSSDWFYINIVPRSSSCVIKVVWISNSDYTKAQCKSTYWLIEDSECVGMTSLECQTQYSLIPISSVDSTYCVNNNLCPTCSDCSSWTWIYSNVYINNILHLWAPNIIINIPQEIDRDYAYTSWSNNMNIDVVGYNVDYDYMDNVVDIQNYKPWNEDLQSIITDIIPLFVPWLVIILFLYFIFKFIKKVF